uniref:Uncharacterized protein n=1 Tax=Oryza punctata TaxID=4537 RepID=A0A0E0K8L3_ORYPU
MEIFDEKFKCRVHVRNKSISFYLLFNRMIGEDVRLVDDSQLPNLFEMYKTESQFILIVAVLDNKMDCTFGVVVLDNKMDGISKAISAPVVDNEVEPICVVPPDNYAHMNLNNPLPMLEVLKSLQQRKHLLENQTYLTMRKNM